MKRIYPFILIAIIIAAIAVACAVNPVTGKRELMLISEQQEISLGMETDQQIRSQYGVYNDARLNAYVQRVGATMTAHTHRPQLKYSFTVLDSPVVNAFAVPGGYIYVTRGILAMMNSEAELAVVLGHELGHVNARHSARRLSNMIFVQAGLAVGSALSETFADLAGIAGIGIQLLFLKYSRDDERQADRLGVEYARQGQYNPAKMIDFFASLQKLGDMSGGHSLPGFLSTHPLTSERIVNTEAMIADSDTQLKVAQDAYFNRIDNMIYGADPRQGFVEGNAFYHPEMRFKFSYPSQWKIQNTPAQVTLVSQDEKAAVILQAEESSENLMTYAQKKAANLKDAQMLMDRSLTINQLASYQQVHDYPQENQQDLRILSTYIKYGPHIYTFTALTTEDAFSDYNQQFEPLINSFSRLNDKRYLNRRPRRLTYTKGDGRQTLQALFQKAGMPKDIWPQFAIMNSLELSQIPARGQRVKIVR